MGCFCRPRGRGHLLELADVVIESTHEVDAVKDECNMLERLSRLISTPPWTPSTGS